MTTILIALATSNGERFLCEEPEDSLIRVEEGLHLDFLPAGDAPKLLNTNKILGSRSMRLFFTAARNHYDYMVLVLDLASLASVVGTRATTHFIDSHTYAVEWGCTKIKVVKGVFSRKIFDATLGTVLNKAYLSMLRRYDRHGGSGYSRTYYKKYGYIS